MNQLDDNWPTIRRDLRRNFDRAAKSFDRADFIGEITRNSLIDRLRPVSVDASVVIDLGSGTGGSVPALSRLFRKARVVPVDLSREMLGKAQARQGWFSRRAGVQADAARLPLADQGVDVVFCNLMLAWIGNPQHVFLEVSRVLRKGGLFSFATLGPDSLRQLRGAWSQVDPGGRHVMEFADMHDVGDGLVRAGLADPVLDVDRLTVSYSSAARLFRDLAMIGARNSLPGRGKGLLGRHRFQQLCETLERSAADGAISIDLELVYGHCWGAGRSLANGEIRLDADRIPVRQR